MKAVVNLRSGGPEVLELRERPVPQPEREQIRVRVRASALNRADLLQRRGAYPAPPGAPADISGLEYAGEVDARGEGADRWAVGDRVMGITGGGGHAEYVLGRNFRLVRGPQKLRGLVEDFRDAVEQILLGEHTSGSDADLRGKLLDPLTGDRFAILAQPVRCKIDEGNGRMVHGSPREEGD